MPARCRHIECAPLASTSRVVRICVPSENVTMPVRGSKSDGAEVVPDACTCSVSAVRAQAGGDGGGQIGHADNMRQYIDRLVGACACGKAQGQIPVIRPPDGDIGDRRMTGLQALPDAQRFQRAPRAGLNANTRCHVCGTIVVCHIFSRSLRSLGPYRKAVHLPVRAQSTPPNCRAP